MKVAWNNYAKGRHSDKPPKPFDIPAKPSQTYKNKGWKGYGDWLGTGTIATFHTKYRKFEDARDFVRKLKLRSQAEWKNYVNGEYTDKLLKPSDIPSHPDNTYREKGWKGYGDWLGAGTVATFE